MLVSVAQAQIFFLALTRILAVIIQVPVLAGPLVPNPVKIGLGFLLAMVMISWQPLPADAPGLTSVAFGLAIGRELLIGTLAGFAAALAFGSLQIAGEVMGVGSGFGAGKVINPVMENSGSALDQFFMMTAMLLFLVMNGHHSFLLGLQRTITILPLNNPLPEFTLERLLKLSGQMLTAGIQMAFPVMGALLLTDLTLGLLARVAPQVQVFFLGVPLKVGVGLIALALTLGLLLPWLYDFFQAIGPNGVRLLGN